MKKTEWLDVSVSPVHLGFYQVRAQDGAFRYLEYTATGWFFDGHPFTHWRGQKVELKQGALQKDRARLAKHLKSPSAKSKAAVSALRLARHMVATQQDAYTRSLHYQIAMSLNSELEAADHVQSAAAHSDLPTGAWDKIMARLDKLTLRESLPR